MNQWRDMRLIALCPTWDPCLDMGPSIACNASFVQICFVIMMYNPKAKSIQAVITLTMLQLYSKICVFLPHCFRQQYASTVIRGLMYAYKIYCAFTDT